MTTTIVPAVDAQHPAALAFHSLNNCAQILRTEPEEWDDLAQGAAIEHVQHATVQGAALFQLLREAEQLVDTLRGDVTLRDDLLAAMDRERLELLEDGIRQAHTIACLERTDTENKQRIAHAQHTVEEIERDIVGLVDRAAQLHSRIRGIQLYNRTAANPARSTVDVSRSAAAGR